MIKKLIELSSWENLTRNDLLSLANLPENFELRALPDFPTTEEAARLVGEIYRHQSKLTDAWPVLHQKVASLPKLVQQALLKACDGQAKRELENLTAYGYGFDPERYVEIVADIKKRHGKISDILNQI